MRGNEQYSGRPSPRQLRPRAPDLLSCQALRTTRFVPLLIASLTASCGGGSPTDPGKPTPTPGFAVSGFVFYDENANGIADPTDVVRLPGVSVSIGGETASTTAGGRFTVADVPTGLQSATIRPDDAARLLQARPGAERQRAGGR